MAKPFTTGKKQPPEPGTLEYYMRPPTRVPDPGFKRPVSGDMRSPFVMQCKAPIRGEVLPTPAAPRPALGARLR